MAVWLVVSVVPADAMNSIYMWVTMPPLPPVDNYPATHTHQSCLGSFWKDPDRNLRKKEEAWNRFKEELQFQSQRRAPIPITSFINSRHERDGIYGAPRVTPQLDQDPTWGQMRIILYFLNFCKQACFSNINNHSLSGAHRLWCFRLDLMLT